MMGDPFFVKRSSSLAAVSVLLTLLPGVILPSTLYLIARMLGVPFDKPLTALAVLASALGVLLLQTHRNGNPVYMSSALAVAVRLLLGWVALLGLLLAVGYIGGVSEAYPRRVLLPWAVAAPLACFVGTLALLGLMRHLTLSRENERTAVIVGYNEAAASLAERVTNRRELCLRLLGFFDDRGEERLKPLHGIKQLGSRADVGKYVRENSVDVIFIALPIRHVRRVMDLLDDLRDSTASIYYVPDIFVFDLIQSRVGDIMGVPVVAMCETPFYGYRGAIKRVMDVVLTLGILVFALPLMAVIAVAIKLTSPGPAIFRQRRYGLGGEEIIVYKFRTMYVTEDGPNIVQAKKDDARVTRVGRFLRRYSLDELPQLFNVLQGSMSLVGPRPHAVAHNEQYRKVIKGYMVRHKVLPGITGLAQVSGYRGETAALEQMKARVECDLDYLRKWTPLLDLKILLLTTLKIFNDRKAY